MIYIIIGINIRKINNQAREFSFLLFVCFVTSELQEIIFLNGGGHPSVTLTRMKI